MGTKIFVNLPVKDLDQSKAFFSKLGYSFNAQFTDDSAASMVIGEDIYAMLLVEPFFKTFTNKGVVDARNSTEVIVALSAESKAEVDDILARAVGAGARESRDPQDLGFMYARAFEDLDGHIWEYVWMDPSTISAT